MSAAVLPRPLAIRAGAATRWPKTLFGSLPLLLGIIIAFFRNKETVNVDEVDLLKW